MTAAPIAVSKAPIRNYPASSHSSLPVSGIKFAGRFITLTGKVLAEESGEQRGLLKSFGAIALKFLKNADLSKVCFEADSLLKILVNADSFDRIRKNSFKDNVDKVKTYVNAYFFMETLVKVGAKYKVHHYTKILVPLAWTSLVIDILQAFYEASESVVKLTSSKRMLEYKHLNERIERSELASVGLSAGSSKHFDTLQDREDHIFKWKVRKTAHILDCSKQVANVAFQLSLIVMFCLLAAPLIGGTIGTAALTSSATVAVIGLTKLAIKVGKEAVLDSLSPERRQREGKGKTKTPIHYSFEGPKKISKYKMAASAA